MSDLKSVNIRRQYEMHRGMEGEEAYPVAAEGGYYEEEIAYEETTTLAVAEAPGSYDNDGYDGHGRHYDNGHYDNDGHYDGDHEHFGGVGVGVGVLGTGVAVGAFGPAYGSAVQPAPVVQVAEAQASARAAAPSPQPQQVQPAAAKASVQQPAAAQAPTTPASAGAMQPASLHCRDKPTPSPFGVTDDSIVEYNVNVVLLFQVHSHHTRHASSLIITLRAVKETSMMPPCADSQSPQTPCASPSSLHSSCCARASALSATLTSSPSRTPLSARPLCALCTTPSTRAWSAAAPATRV